MSRRDAAQRRDQQGEGAQSSPSRKIVFLFQGDCGDGAAIDGLLAIAGVAATWVAYPGLIISKLEHLGAELTAESTSDTQIHFNLRRSHDHYSLLGVFDLLNNSSS